MLARRAATLGQSRWGPPFEPCGAVDDDDDDEDDDGWLINGWLMDINGY